MLDTLHMLFEVVWYTMFWFVFSLMVAVIQLNQKRLKSKKNVEIVIV